jgi:hypothetical protein
MVHFCQFVPVMQISSLEYVVSEHASIQSSITSVPKQVSIIIYQDSLWDQAYYFFDPDDINYASIIFNVNDTKYVSIIFDGSAFV